MIYYLRLGSLVLVLLLMTCSTAALATNFLMEDFPTQINRVTYKYQRPLFHHDVETNFLTGFHELSFALKSGDRLSIIGSLPLAHGGATDESETMVGNIYMGALWGDKDLGGNTAFSLGLYLPTAQFGNNTAAFTGILSEPSRFHLFLRDIMTLHANGLLYKRSSSGLYFRGEFGAEYSNYVGGGGSRGEMSLRYGAGIGYEEKGFSLGVELVGYWLVTANVAQLSDGQFNVVSFGGEFRGSVFIPGLYYSIPLNDEFSDFVDSLLGIRVRTMF